ncbi:MAG: ubiquinol-cytochrome c reductase cytochrome b subunit [Actinomycetota bacterium]|nr:ubiquinol-cytochrome c reductase cytochrome b subunit [Actinomycetota bacterium]
MSRLAKIPGETANWVDDRFAPAGPLRRTFNKVFPDHWSFMIGEIALYSFVILLITGTYLTLFFNPSQQEVIYHGSYVPLRGITMTQAYESTLRISFDVRGGLIMRQIHHWAALMFMAAIVVHMFRIFFTGAFRKPREVNWLIGVTLLVLGTVEGFAGYSLPDDLLSGTGLRIASSIILSIPVIGSWASFLVFGGEYPGELILGRLYIVHVLLVPGILLALISAHLAILVKQKHTQFPGPGRTEHNVVGVRMFPTFALKGGGFFMLVFSVCALLGGIAQINPIWLYGPYSPAVVSAGSQPDWYIGFLDGSTRLWPAWEIRAFGHTVPAIFWPTVVLPGILFTVLALYPFLEARFTKDRAHHNLLQRPRDVPTRTALGAMAIAFYLVLLISGGNDLIAMKFDISLNAMTWIGRIGLILAPPIAYYLTHRICLGLQQHDREILVHGVETGVIRRLPTGEFIEIHQPLGEVDEHGHAVPIEYAGAPVPARPNKLGLAGRTIKGFFAPIEEPAEELQHTDQGTQAERRELTGVDD